VAQTKKKRQTKHRGNAAGVVEVRGRTGRPASPEEKKAQQRAQTKERRLARPPSWTTATRNSAMIGVLIFVVLLFENHSKSNALPSALIVAALAFFVYVPVGYYLEKIMWKRRMSKLAPTGSSRRK
jgi:hypothetical protein